MITFAWYVLSGREKEVDEAIARGSTTALWQRHLVYIAVIIEALVEFTILLTLTGLI